MNRRVVIADAGPLIALTRIDALGLLRGLFGRVYITVVVQHEILPPLEMGRFPDTDKLTHALDEGWIDLIDPAPGDWKSLNSGIDPGEASALQAAIEGRKAGDAVLLIMDNRVGRLEAKRLGLPLIGTAAIIGLAKSQGLIPAVKPVLQGLVGGGYFLGESVIEAVLTEAGEA